MLQSLLRVHLLVSHHLVCKKHLILIGLMGVGKSTIGHQLAACKDLPFVDTDQYVEHTQQQSIATIFQQQGEAAFRLIEKKALCHLLEKEQRTVVATGGGIVLDAENRESMRQHGWVVWLNVTPHNLYHRLRGNRSRPLLQQDNPRQILEKLYQQRHPWYQACCDVEIHCDALTPRKVVDEVMQWVTEAEHENTNILR